MADTAAAQTVPVPTTTLLERLKDPVFWFTIASSLIGMLVTLGVIGPDNVTVKAIGLIGTFLGMLGFKINDAVKSASANKASAAVTVATIAAAASATAAGLPK